jgi:hypothetical protein
MTGAADKSLGTIVAIVAGVLGISALVVFGLFRMARRVDRMEKEPRYRRRFLLGMGLLYLGSIVYCAVQVLIGDLPKESLLGFPVVALLCWISIRAGIRVKVPPDKGAS